MGNAAVSPRRLPASNRPRYNAAARSSYARRAPYAPALPNHLLAPPPCCYPGPPPTRPCSPCCPPASAWTRWQGSAYISLVGIGFADTRVWGLPAYPRRYAQVNLRFYVRRRRDAGCPAPGVVFIRQIVPHRITAGVARILYGEPFARRPVFCAIAPPDNDDGSGSVAYRWQSDNGRWHSFRASVPSVAGAGDCYGDIDRDGVAAPGSLADFLTARYWGYNGKPHGPTRAYRVTRSPWRLQPAAAVATDADFAAEYGPALAAAMSAPPASALLADGGRARIHLPRRL